MSVKLAARSLVRYLAPISLLTLLVFAPLVYVALHVKAPLNAPQAREVLRVAWLLSVTAVFGTFGLAGAIAPLVRSIAAGAPLPQHHALWVGLGGLVRAIVPTLVAVVAIALGLAALAVPGLVLLVLFSLVGASDAVGVRARLADSVVAVRAQRGPTIVVVSLAVALAVLVIVIPQLQIAMPKQPKPAQLVGFAQLVRHAALVLTVAAPILATALAAIHTTSRVRVSA